jgi:hypothetical protein
MERERGQQTSPDLFSTAAVPNSDSPANNERPRTQRGPASAPARPVGRKGRPGIVRTSLYLPEAFYEGLRGSGLL